MTLDEAVEIAFAGRTLRVELSPEQRIEARDLLQTEVDRLAELATWEAQFARSILEPMAEELYIPQLQNAAIA